MDIGKTTRPAEVWHEMIFQNTSRKVRSAVLSVVATALLLGPSMSAMAVQIPNPGSQMFLQTSGPNAGISIGDYYTSPAGGNTDHVFILRVPADWPSGVPVTVALFDPELALPNPASPRAADEIRSAADTSTFRLESPSGSTVASKTYSDSSTNGLWVELATFDPGITGWGTYEVHVTVSDDDDNSWRIDASHDPDCVAGGSCASAFLVSGNETDVAPGGSATLALGVLRTSYQHDGGGSVCVDHAFYVGPATPRPLRAHNFDMDDAGSVTYTKPGGGTVAGTVSGNGRWNGSVDATRVGDVLSDINGWWSAHVCISAGNQYVFEAPGFASFHSIPPTPRLTVAKDDGVASAAVGDELVYTITVENVSNGDAHPGTAYGVVVTDTLPSGTLFESCDAPGGVTCTETSGTVVASIADPIAPGDSISFDVTVTVQTDVATTITNDVSVEYQDGLDNEFPRLTDSDTDTIVFAPVLVVDATGTLQMLRGDTASLTFTVSHDATSDQSPIFNPGVVCDICDSVSYVSGDGDSDGVLDFGEAWTYEATAPSDGSSPDPLVAAVTANGDDRAGNPLVAAASHETDLVEPGSIGGTVFEDLNGNGILDSGEPRFDGASVELNDGSAVDSAVSSSGAYLFEDLYPAGYEVEVDETTLPAGLQATTANPRGVALAEGAIVSGVDFGYAYPATISGTVFADVNLNGTQNPGDTGLPNVVVTILDDLGTPVASTSTAADGTYAFTVLPGVYSVEVGAGLPSGWVLTTPATVDLGLVVSGDVVTDVDFGTGNRAPELIGDHQVVEFGGVPESLTAVDPEGSAVSYRLVGGTLPDGLTLNSDGSFSGQASESGVFDLIVEVCDDADPSACAEFPYQLEVLVEVIVEDVTTDAGTDTTVTDTAVSGGALPFTGFETDSVLAIGIGLLFVGYILISADVEPAVDPEKE